MSHSPSIWLLADDRPGNVNQALGVAEALALPFTVKNIRYTKLARLPNFVKCHSLLGIKPESKNELYAPWPDVVISAGRKTAPVALYIKQKSPSTKIVQIMRPGLPTPWFDLLVLPGHDSRGKGQGNKGIRKFPFSLIPLPFITIGAPNRITEKLLAQEKPKWEPKFANLPHPRIALLVGGNSKQGEFTEKHCDDLIEKANKLVQESGGSLLVTTSRRTPVFAIDKLRQELPKPNYFYDFRDGGENPYLGFLACADAIIPSGDSISMCSESCSTGKPVYIYSPSDLTPSKHKRFHQTLIKGGYAKMLGDKWEDYSYEPLGDAKIVAEEIKKYF